MVITSIAINQIQGYHSAVKQIIAETTSIMYKLGPHECSSVFLTNLVKLHPLHLLKSEEEYQLIAGFRAYELAKLILGNDSIIDCIVHDISKITEGEIENLVISDLLGSPLLFQFSKDYSKNINKIKKSIGNKTVKEILGNISSKQKIDARKYDLS